jgi:3-phosphoshikimate 1-carboxyvinyltransferase
MGASIARSAGGLRVSGPLRGPSGAEVRLDAGDSGTAARFLTAAAAATRGRFLLGGSPRLCERPIGELVTALRAAGARIEYRGREGCLPVAIEGGALHSGAEMVVDASRSSQFLSALLLAGVAAEGGVRVRAAGRVASGPYVATTLEVLRDFGHTVEAGPSFLVRRGARVAERYETPGDYSAAVPLVAAVGAACGEVTLGGLRWPSPDADAGALPVLAKMGVSIAPGPDGLTASAAGRPVPASAVATEFPDAVPSLAALALLASGESVFSGVGHLRLKESDRLASVAALASAVGARAVVSEDSLSITGPATPPPGGTVRLPTFRDHRIAMAAGILALALPGVLIEDPDCVAKSYPRFFQDLDGLAVR